MAGFLAAALSGFLLGVVIVYSRRVEQAVEPFLIVSQVVPKVALAPIFIIWFGHGLQPKIIIAATIAFFPVLVNTVLGLKAADHEIIELMNSIAATKRQIFWRVRLPNSLPYILPSLKVAALLSVVGAMVGEFVGSDKGLGYLMILGDVNLDTDLLFAALVIVTLVGLLIYGAVGLVEQRVAQRYGSGDGRLTVAA
jgi:NitT/TauT family transport system permease protein